VEAVVMTAPIVEDMDVDDEVVPSSLPPEHGHLEPEPAPEVGNSNRESVPEDEESDTIDGRYIGIEAESSSGEESSKDGTQQGPQVTSIDMTDAMDVENMSVNHL
jgi:hypothetical protein